MIRAGVLSSVIVLAVAQVASAADSAAPPPPPDAATLNKLSARLAPVDLTVDVQALPANERAALVELLAAAKIMDALFLRQAWAGNEALLLDLVRDRSPLGQARLHAFLQNKGPWPRLDGDRPFMAGIGPKPPRRQLLSGGRDQGRGRDWMHALPAPARATAEGLLHQIRGRRRQVQRSRTASNTRAS